MSETTVKVKSPSLILDKCIDLLSRIWNDADPKSHWFGEVSELLEEFESAYGKNSTARLKVISEERKKHAKELNGKDTD